MRPLISSLPGSPTAGGDTPPSIGVVGYNNPSDNRGEAGRWFELELFGGTLEYYRDLHHSNRQVRTRRKSVTLCGTNFSASAVFHT